MKKKHLGSSFDNFLQTERLLETATATATKRVIAHQIAKEMKVTIRCIPFDESPEVGTCPFSGEPSCQRVVWAKSY